MKQWRAQGKAETALGATVALHAWVVALATVATDAMAPYAIETGFQVAPNMKRSSNIGIRFTNRAWRLKQCSGQVALRS